MLYIYSIKKQILKQSDKTSSWKTRTTDPTKPKASLQPFCLAGIDLSSPSVSRAPSHLYLPPDLCEPASNSWVLGHHLLPNDLVSCGPSTVVHVLDPGSLNMHTAVKEDRALRKEWFGFWCLLTTGGDPCSGIPAPCPGQDFLPNARQPEALPTQPSSPWVLGGVSELHHCLRVPPDYSYSLPLCP